MRSAERLDDFYEEIKQIHKKEFSDWRFGQLMSNFGSWLYKKYNIDFFYLEEPVFLKRFKEFEEDLKKH